LKNAIAKSVCADSERPKTHVSVKETLAASEKNNFRTM